ncbi:MAG TPA: hypothetical protein PLM07_10380 [Candidatus Rifleibacterium sp.]|nr:hypothetical protein [Candidatus Rifleibacterium sp.]HPT46296.1 hypothetical protein [Candidatus Rifleibacterium sp.]
MPVKYLNLMVFAVLCLFAQSVSAVELDDVYRNLGDYQIVATQGVRLYFPNSAEKAVPRILAGFAAVHAQLVQVFPDQKNYEATVILNDHDDRISSSADSDFDWINLGMFEEIGVLSTRAYSLEKRFAMRLSTIMILRTLAASSNSWRRQLAIFAVPQWFMDGMALSYAFELDSIHFSRLLDMARHDRLYSIDQLSTILSQPTLTREEMTFQAHSMLEFWEKTYKKGAALELMKSIFRKPASFDKLFRAHYGVNLNEAYRKYREYVCERCSELKEKAAAQEFTIEDLEAGGKFFRSLRQLGPDEKIWVSSRRYSTETYDLFYKKGNGRVKMLLKNVHPLLMVDEMSREIIIGRYQVNQHRQRRLGLWSVTPEGREKCLSNEAGSFKPLGRKFGRIFYTSIKGGVTRVMSVDPEFKNSTQVEFDFGPDVRPLDLALSNSCRELYYTCETTDFKKRLVVVSIVKDDEEKQPHEILASHGDIRSLVCHDDLLWFAAEKDFSTTQLFSIDRTGKKLEKHSQLPGGVWDINPVEDRIEVVTLDKGGFWKTSLPDSMACETIELADAVPVVKNEFRPEKTKKYRSEYHTSYWKPLLSEDEDGAVFGIYNYRTDRLDRSSIVLAPTYGFASKNWGYNSVYMQRFGLFKVTGSIIDHTRKKSYLDNDYFERSSAKVLDVAYPLNLSTTLSLGVDLTQRQIAEIPENSPGPFPSVGRDHSFYGRINHRAIRTEPYWEVFPRLGRTITASYKRGNEILDGEMNYDSTSLRWTEHLPVRDMVLTCRTWIAEDDKENQIRRPDDLSLGGEDFMRGFDSAFKSGDRLRAFALHLGRPVRFQFPKFMSFIYNEFMVAELFWETGDVTNQGNFHWYSDNGIEIRSQVLLLKRLPMIVRIGFAAQNGSDKTNTYFAIDLSDLAGVFQ